MMTLLRWQQPECANWTPFRTWLPPSHELDELLDSPWAVLNESSRSADTWLPPVDLYEDNDNLQLKAELPGLKKEDIQITLQDGVLTLKGKRQAEAKNDNAQVHRSERFSGTFQRSISLPAEVNWEQTKATYRDGVLTVVLPKAEAVKPRQIAVA